MTTVPPWMRTAVTARSRSTCSARCASAADGKTAWASRADSVDTARSSASSAAIAVVTPVLVVASWVPTCPNMRPTWSSCSPPSASAVRVAAVAGAAWYAGVPLLRKLCAVSSSARPAAVVASRA